MLELLIKGLIIGLCISIPLGPIGVLCVQRTLTRGRIYGIVTGLGATTSDLIYTIITLFFLQFVIGFINEYRVLFELLIAIILLVFGFYIYKNNPSLQPKINEKGQSTMFSDYLSSLGLTLSNPLILFFLIALFARFDFIEDNSSFVVYFVGIFAILLGAFLWWCSLTFIVGKFKDKMSYRGLRNVNIITGLVIMLTGFIGFILAFFKLFS